MAQENKIGSILLLIDLGHKQYLPHVKSQMFYKPRIFYQLDVK